MKAYGKRRTLSSWFLARHIPPKRLFTFRGIYVVISQKTVLFTVNAVGTSDPALDIMLFTVDRGQDKSHCYT